MQKTHFRLTGVAQKSSLLTRRNKVFQNLWIYSAVFARVSYVHNNYYDYFIVAKWRHRAKYKLI